MSVAYARKWAANPDLLPDQATPVGGIGVIIVTVAGNAIEMLAAATHLVAQASSEQFANDLMLLVPMLWTSPWHLEAP